MPLKISAVHQFEQQKEETWDLAFSQDGTRLVSSDGSTLYLWGFNKGENWIYDRSLAFKQAAVLHFAPNFVSYIDGGFIRLISFDGNEVATFPCPSSPGWEFSPDLRWLVSNGEEGFILLWNLISHQNFSIPIPFQTSNQGGEETGYVGRFLFTPDYQKVVLWADGSEGSLHICSFDPEHRHILLQRTLPHGMLDGRISLNGKMLAVVVSNEQTAICKQDIHIYDLESSKLLCVFPQTSSRGYCLLAFSPDNHYLASCKSDGWIDIFSLDSFTLITSFAAHPDLSTYASDPIGGLDWSRTGYIATGGASVFEKDMEKTDYTIKIWKVEAE